jgi:hypothetical protein
VWRWSDERKEAYAAARAGKNLYRCNDCKAFKAREEIRCDHVQPVIDPKKGWQGWDAYYRRMFPGTKGYQMLCNPCHDKKTKDENGKRKAAKRKRTLNS